MNDTSEWVSLGEAAGIIGVHPATIRNWADNGELAFRRTPGGHRRFRRADLQQWLAQHRVVIPAEAQVVVQSALGRARLDIGDRQKLMTLAWYDGLDADAREIMRQHGLRLMDALMRYLTHPETEIELRTARDIGQTYGDLLKDQGLTLSQTLQGYFYFVDFLQEAVIQLSETGATRPAASWGDMLRQMNRFTREILTTMIAAYEQP
jgi:excisionase family DNA binding protein